MNQELWTAVDRYFDDSLMPPDRALAAAVEASTVAGLPAIQVAPNQGKLLFMLARIHGARRILEIGTLGGYSTIWLARGLAPGGRVVTLESEARHAEVAQANIERAGLAGVVDVRLGKALETLPKVEADGLGPFDLVFIDADKQSIAEYFAWALKLSRVGSVIVVDNVVREGKVVDASSTDEMVRGVRRFVEIIEREPRVTATAVQTVGSKGYDGFLVALVVGDK